MRSIFLSFHFGEADRDFVRLVESLVESHNLRIVTGENLGGGALSPGVMRRIESADALIALMTRRDEVDNYGGTHPWVVDEFKHAQSKGRRAIAIVHPGVAVLGAYSDHERIHFDPTDPLKTFLTLSRTLGIWKSEAGRMLRVQVFPPELAEEVAGADGATRCYFRLHTPTGKRGEWQEARWRAEGEGTYLFLDGVSDDSLIQVKIELQGVIWKSRVTEQRIPAELKHP